MSSIRSSTSSRSSYDEDAAKILQDLSLFTQSTRPFNTNNGYPANGLNNNHSSDSTRVAAHSHLGQINSSFERNRIKNSSLASHSNLCASDSPLDYCDSSSHMKGSIESSNRRNSNSNAYARLLAGATVASADSRGNCSLSNHSSISSSTQQSVPQIKSNVLYLANQYKSLINGQVSTKSGVSHHQPPPPPYSVASMTMQQSQQQKQASPPTRISSLQANQATGTSEYISQSQVEPESQGYSAAGVQCDNLIVTRDANKPPPPPPPIYENLNKRAAAPLPHQQHSFTLVSNGKHHYLK